MKWNRLLISIVLLSVCPVANVIADDSIYNERTEFDAGERETVYEKRAEKRRRQWAKLIPTQFVVQNAGNMGVVSAGVGWNYAHNKLETHILFGYIPPHQSTRGKLTMTIKENYIPWDLPLTKEHSGNSKPLQSGWSICPVTASLYINTVYGHEFWKSQPNRYPNKYYDFMSTKFRLNAAVGQRITWQIPRNKRKHAKSISLFYEVSSCDLYIRAKFVDNRVPLNDILGLSLGIKLQTL